MTMLDHVAAGTLSLPDIYIFFLQMLLEYTGNLSSHKYTASKYATLAFCMTDKEFIINLFISLGAWAPFWFSHHYVFALHVTCKSNVIKESTKQSCESSVVIFSCNKLCDFN